MNESSIIVQIAGREYRLRGDEKRRSQIKNAAEQINRLIKLYGEKFTYNDSQNLLAMVCLHQTAALTEIDDMLENIEEIIEREFQDDSLFAV